MKRKKSEADVTKQTLAQEEGVTLEPKHHSAPKATVVTTSVSQTVAPVSDGVIYLDPERPTAVPQTQWEAGVKELNADNPKPKRKYTKRAKKVVVTPTFIDAQGILTARVDGFTSYATGKITFEQFSTRDDKFRQLAELAAEINK
jgi:hypothetical protein